MEDYFRHMAEEASSVSRIVSRTIAIVTYGLIGVYVLSFALPAIVPTSVSAALTPSSDFLPNEIADSSVDSQTAMMSNGLHAYDLADLGGGEM